jgi:hypothetical protein
VQELAEPPREDADLDLLLLLGGETAEKIRPREGHWTFRTGPSVPTGRLQSIAVDPFHWFFLAVS